MIQNLRRYDLKADKRILDGSTTKCPGCYDFDQNQSNYSKFESDQIFLISSSVSRFDPLATLETTAYNKQNMRAYEFCHFWNRFCPQCNPAVVKLTLVNELFRSM